MDAIFLRRQLLKWFIMKHLFANNGFQYHEIPVSFDEAPTEFSGALSLWRSKFVDGKLPSWDDFDFYDFVGLHGWVALSEITFGPIDLHYRLFGTKIVELLGEDITGKRYSETGPNVFHWQDDLDYFEKICKSKSIGYATGSFVRIGFPTKRVSFLDIPLARSGFNSSQISHILTITYKQE